ncbi:MAG: hypothetical protein ACXVWZ_05570, partial [Nocardioides sp.]
RGDPADRAPFGAPAPAAEVAAALLGVLGVLAVPAAGGLGVPTTAERADTVAALAFAHGWEVVPDPDGTRPPGRLRVRPVTP